MQASATVGRVWPTFRVPGMSSSRTRPPSLKSELVVANEPTPRVSKKFVRNPIPMSIGPGRAGCLVWRVAWYQRKMYATVKMAKPMMSAVSIKGCRGVYPETSLRRYSRDVRRSAIRGAGSRRRGRTKAPFNDRYRICFEWRDGDAYGFEIVDYH